jgi:SAM-dependent methyltransferase
MGVNSQHAVEVEEGSRFAFGENWSRFLAVLNEDRIEHAEQSLCEMLALKEWHGKQFLDAGSGSGLFSLAARRLGASVHSFDYDTLSVACTRELKQRYFPHDPDWRIEQGSVLDAEYLRTLGKSDIVYSWGVLHHTGNLSQALDNVAGLVGDDGKLFIAIYNDQGRTSDLWLKIKQAYNRLPRGFRWVVLWPATVRLWGPTTMRDLLAGKPFHTWRNYSKTSSRGMSPWRNVVDWVGGLPFEVATPEEIITVYGGQGFTLEQLKTCEGGHGCNEFVFRKT